MYSLNRRNQPRTVVSHVADCPAHFPCLHLVSRVRPEQVNGQLCRVSGSHPAAIVFRRARCLVLPRACHAYAGAASVEAGVAFFETAFVAITATTSAPRAEIATANATQSSGSKATFVFLSRDVISLIFRSSSMATTTS